MPSLDRVDIQAAGSRTEIIDTSNQNNQRQGLAGNGNYLPMTKSANEIAASNPSELDQAVEAVAGYVQNIARDINFSVDEGTNKFVVTVTDQDSGELIRQIPDEEMLEISKNLEEAQQRNTDKIHKGLLFEGDA